MTTGKATLGPASLDASRGVAWSIQTGVDPVVQVFEMDAKEAEKLLPGGSSAPHTLTVEGAGGEKFEAKGLYVVGEVPSQDPHRRAVVVADRRIWWRRKRAFQRFNIRRRTGQVRRLDPDNDLPQQIAPTADDVAYARWSTKNEGRPYKATEALAEILEQIDPGQFPNAPKAFAQQSVDHVEIDDQGPDAARLGFGLVVGAAPFVDLGGAGQIADTLDVAGAAATLARVGGEFVGSEHPAHVMLQAQRPGLVRCLLSVEQEIRVNSFEPGDTVEARGRRADDLRGMDNVLPVPDASITLANGRTVVQGTWVTFTDYLAAVNAQGNLQLSDEVLRRFWITPWLEAYFTGLGQLVPDANWVARIAAIRQHYRKTYRIRRGWMDRVYSLRANRLAIVDEETGTRAKSVAYMDWCVRYNAKGIFHEAANLHVMENFAGSVGLSEPLSSGRISPYEVAVLDDELGILRFDERHALAGTWALVVPGRVENVPTLRLSQRSAPVTADGSRWGRGGVGVGLLASFRVSTVVSVAPCAPNGKAQLFAVDVTPAQAKKYLPASAVITPAQGPAWELRIGPGLATARFAWSDAKADAIERSFGVGIAAKDAGNREAIKDLILNAGEVEDLCHVLAAQLYATLADHVEGAWTGPLSPDVVPVGNLSRVTHSLAPNGVLSTTFSMPGELAPVDGLALLPTSARRLFQRLAQP